MTGRPLQNIITQDIFYLGSFQSLSIGIHSDMFKVFDLEKFFGKDEKIDAGKICLFM
jgi:hypothetical protein|nr:MAG TPA: hypothetical protein [Caudoviricetes sp.]